MGFVSQWRDIERRLPQNWGDARLQLMVRDERDSDRAASLLGPANPARRGNVFRFSVARRGAGPKPDALRRLLRRLDTERVRGNLELVATDEAVAAPEIARGSLREEWDAVVKALPLLGNEPFFHLNADTMWIDGVRPNLSRLAETFDPARMDILLLMAPTTSSIGYAGRGDYSMLPDGALRKRREHQVVPFVYAGAAIMSPSLFADAPAGEFSLTKLFDQANEQERLFGLRLDGVWMHVGTPDAVQAAEEAFLESVA